MSGHEVEGPADLAAALEAVSLNLWQCSRCEGWAARLGNAGPSRHLAEGLATLTPERVLDLANELAGVGWAGPLTDECPPAAAATAHNRRELAAAEAHNARLLAQLATAHNARLLALMGGPPPVVVGRGTPEDPYRDLSDPLIASHCVGPDPWYLRHHRALGVAMWSVVAIVGASTLLGVFTAEPGVWLRGLFGTTVGAVTLLMTRQARRGGVW